MTLTLADDDSDDDDNDGHDNHDETDDNVHSNNREKEDGGGMKEFILGV